MTRRLASLVLALSLGLGPATAETPSVTDPEVAKGIRQVEEGDFDAAIFTLDGASRRLSATPTHPDLPQAYLHLGIAYVGKGHEAAAKAKFRDAIRQIRDLSLSADKYPPKVINVFEAARDEVSREAPAAPKAASTTPAPTSKPKKGGGGKGLLIGGLVVAAGAGVAVAAGGGGGDSGGGTPTTTPQRQTESFTGTLGFNENANFQINVGSSGLVEAALTWAEPSSILAMDLHSRTGGGIVATSARGAGTTAMLSANVVAGAYVLQVLHRGDGCNAAGAAGAAAAPPCVTGFQLRVTHP